MRLAHLLADKWDEIDAHYYTPGRTILREKPHRIANLVYSWAIERVEPDKFDDWLFELRDLLPWQDATSEAAADLESQSFFAMQAKGSG